MSTDGSTFTTGEATDQGGDNGGRPGLASALLGIFAAVGAINVVGDAIGNDLMANTTKPLLLPLLVAFSVAAAGISRPTMKLLVAAQFFAWLGDLALMSSEPVVFLAGMGAFLVMQVVYIVGFFRLGARDGFARRRWVLFAFPAFWVVANAALWAGLGPMRLPIAVYAAALVTMAMTSVALGTRVGIGGTLFMLSDLMIGATIAYGNFPGSSPLIMTTYIIGQGLIAAAWVGLVRRRAVD